jgi:hypothetical protein
MKGGPNQGKRKAQPKIKVAATIIEFACKKRRQCQRAAVLPAGLWLRNDDVSSALRLSNSQTRVVKTAST